MRKRILASFVTFLMSAFAMSNAIAADLPEGVKVGDMAPNFVVRNIDGNLVGPPSFKDAKGVILIFTCNHCPYSVANEDRIIALHKAYAPKGWPVLAVNPNDPEKVPEDSFEKMKERAEEKQFPFPYAMDETQNVAKAYGARRTPHVFLLQRVEEGFKVVYIGAIDDSPRNDENVDERFLADALDALIDGKQPKQTLTKAIGCSIKWKE